ncbi:S-adenosyl-L-methionine-dependent methyltransferase, partial [Fistulina hepatica ATCC 64428]
NTLNRVAIRRMETARSIAESIAPEGSKGKVFIEAYAGCGALTRALLELPKERVARVIAVEDHPTYLDYLEPLVKSDPRLKLREADSFYWEVYDQLQRVHLEDIRGWDWNSGPHPQLHFIMHVPTTIKGEQLIAQFLRCIPTRSWFYKYGRVPTTFILNEYFWDRINASVEDTALRCKLSVISQATADFNPVQALGTVYENFWPQRIPVAGKSKLGRRKLSEPTFYAATATPFEKQVIAAEGLPAWDYVLRRLFVNRAQSLSKGLSSLAPGAQSLMRVLEGKLDISKPVRTLSLEEWTKVMEAFTQWPFAPQNLTIDEGFHDKKKPLG